MKFSRSPHRRMMILCLLVVIATTSIKNARAFVPIAPAPSFTSAWPTQAASTASISSQNRRTYLSSSSSSNDDNNDEQRPRSYEEALEHNKKRTDVRRFLTQRALQSFIYLLVSCRDPHTVRWLEETYHFGDLEAYHGTGGLNVDASEGQFAEWDTMLLDLLQRPDDKVIIAARRRGRGHGGWSKNNPHLQDRFVEFEIDIEPASLVSRIVSVRGQIAKEWIHDLATLDVVTQMVLDSYHEKQNAKRQAEAAKSSADDECVDFNDGKDTHHDDECVPIEGLTAPYAGGGGTTSSGRSESTGSSSFGESNDGPSLKSLTSNDAFDRIAMEYLNNNMLSDDTGSSPQRKGSFDLLVLLATQEALHRVLRMYEDDMDERQVSLAWLREFYIPRIPVYFDGDGKYGRADDFLQELLLTPPMTKRLESENKMALIDPLRIAEDILKQRSQVAQDWKQIMEQQVPSDHMELQKAILSVRMGQSTVEQSTSADSSVSSSSSSVAGRPEEMGQFE